MAARKVYLRENPSLFAIATHHRLAPIAAAAQQCLRSRLAQAGALLCHRGDSGWRGLCIGNAAMHGFGAEMNGTAAMRTEMVQGAQIASIATVTPITEPPARATVSASFPHAAPILHV